MINAVARFALAMIRPDITNQNYSVTGHIAFMQKDGWDMRIIIYLEGFQRTTDHGIHIHENPIIGQDCSTAGAHYNPSNLEHGAPHSPIRHYGDMGNFPSDTYGHIRMVFTDKVMSLYGKEVVNGRSIVIHSQGDDFGLADAPQSRVDGNSGPPIACGNIELTDRYWNLINADV